VSRAAPVVLYEDGSLLVVEKPAGVHTAPLRPGETGTLIDLVLAAFPDVARAPGAKPVEPGLVHRLDRETSGCIVVARTAAAFESLRAQFTGGGARKEYTAACAAVEGADVDGPLSIESRFAPLGPGRRMVRVVPQAAPGARVPRGATRDAYATVAEVVAHAPGCLLLRAAISRGFRHQVRAHLAFLGFPILGDTLYGKPVPAGFHARMYLHASRVLFAHPVTGAALEISSPLPPEFSALFPGSR